MSNLLNTPEGRAAVVEMRNYLLRRRLSRFSKRNLVIDYDRFSHGSSEFDLSTILGSLNEAHDDELLDLYRLLGTIGGLDYSIADTTIYIDAVNGSDVNGTGTAARPFASLWFVSLLPKRINHNYRVLITTDLVETDRLVLTNEFGPDGCLSFIGVGAAVEVLAGASGVIGGSVTPNNGANIWPISAVPVAEMSHVWAQPTDGPIPGRVGAVHAIDLANNAIVMRDTNLSGLAPGTNYRFVTPPISVTIPCIEILTTGSLSDTYPLGERRSARVAFVNMKVSLTEPLNYQYGLIIDSRVPVFMSFIDFTYDEEWPGVLIRNSRINEHYPYDQEITTLSETDITNLIYTGILAPQNAGINMNAETYDWVDYWGYIEISGECFVGGLNCRGGVTLWAANAQLLYSGFATLFGDQSICKGDHILAAGNDDTSAIGMWISNSKITIKDVYFYQVDYAIVIDGLTTIRAENHGSDAVYGSIGSYAYEINQASRAWLVDAWTLVSGAINDVDLAAAGATAFPVAGANIASFGSYLYLA